jgi:thioredoxin-dependent peroxiredoxin
MAKLKVGDPAPDFTKPWTGEGDFTLSERRGRWVILAFYPGDETAVCTKQFCDYRDNGARIETLDAEMVGISPQGVESHDSFISHHDLNLPLVADEDLSVSAAYGIKLGPSLRRSIFIVDPEGRIAHKDVKLVGLSFADTDAIAAALTKAKAAAAA